MQKQQMPLRYCMQFDAGTKIRTIIRSSKEKVHASSGYFTHTVQTTMILMHCTYSEKYSTKPSSWVWRSCVLMIDVQWGEWWTSQFIQQYDCIRWSQWRREQAGWRKGIYSACEASFIWKEYDAIFFAQHDELSSIRWTAYLHCRRAPAFVRDWQT